MMFQDIWFWRQDEPSPFELSILQELAEREITQGIRRRSTDTEITLTPSSKQATASNPRSRRSRSHTYTEVSHTRPENISRHAHTGTKAQILSLATTSSDSSDPLVRRSTNSPASSTTYYSARSVTYSPAFPSKPSFQQFLRTCPKPTPHDLSSSQLPIGIGLPSSRSDGRDDECTCIEEYPQCEEDDTGNQILPSSTYHVVQRSRQDCKVKIHDVHHALIAKVSRDQEFMRLMALEKGDMPARDECSDFRDDIAKNKNSRYHARVACALLAEWEKHPMPDIAELMKQVEMSDKEYE